jgi:hypothetical protein
VRTSNVTSRHASVGAVTPRLVHDLNNLLSVANGYLELSENNAEAGFEHIGEVKSAVSQMSSLLRSMRTLMQGNAEQNPSQLIAEWRPALELALGNNIQLALDPAEFDGIPMPDEHSLQSMLICVCLQAAQRLHHGGIVKLTVTANADAWTIQAAFLDREGVAALGTVDALEWWPLAQEFAQASGVALEQGDMQ